MGSNNPGARGAWGSRNATWGRASSRMSQEYTACGTCHAWLWVDRSPKCGIINANAALPSTCTHAVITQATQRGKLSFSPRSERFSRPCKSWRPARHPSSLKRWEGCAPPSPPPWRRGPRALRASAKSRSRSSVRRPARPRLISRPRAKGCWPPTSALRKPRDQLGKAKENLAGKEAPLAPAENDATVSEGEHRTAMATVAARHPLYEHNLRQPQGHRVCWRPARPSHGLGRDPPVGKESAAGG